MGECGCRLDRGVCECMLPEDAAAAREKPQPSGDNGSNVGADVDRAFLVADKNSDGLISREEADKSMTASSDPEEQAELFASLDSDKDGFISRDELIKALSSIEAETDAKAPPGEEL